MRILLVGEYSRLHNSLKEGLVALGHEVVLVSSGDGFKNYPNDLDFSTKFCASPSGRFVQKVAGKLFRLDLHRLERGLRFKRLLPELKNFDVVQLVNEAAVNTFEGWELKLLKKLSGQNKKMFLLCSGADYATASFMMKRTLPYSILEPYFFDPENLKNEYDYILSFLSPGRKKIHDFLYETCRGVIATDLDYVPPLEGNPKFTGLIPNPVNVEKMDFELPDASEKVVIFLGINRHTYHAKGIGYFEKALEIIGEKYREETEIIIVENIPYSEYMKSYARCHILLDQALAMDQGYNALEAMARGKVVFTGAGASFEKQYPGHGKVAVHATPDVDSIVENLSELIENRMKIEEIGRNAREFVRKEHDYIEVASTYVKTWKT